MKTEALLEKLFENSTSMLMVTDEEFNIRYISSSVETSFGLQAFAVIGRNAFEFVDESNRGPWRECLQEANCNMRSEIGVVTPAGKELYFDATVTNHAKNSEIRGLVVMLIDITETRKRRKLLEQTNNHLDHFIFKTIHDLRAPVHSALGLIELSSRSANDDREQHFSMIKSNLQKMDAFIEEVSHYYRNEKLAMVKEQIDFDEIVNQEIESLKNLPGAERIRFEYKLFGDNALLSDPLRIRTILTNIISNSIKYADPAKGDPYIRVVVDIDEKECVVSIKDNGLGIPDQYQQKIFDIFFRYHTQIQGTGLGLYIVQDTVNRLGGKIDLCSRSGQGTTFSITIPNQVEPSHVLVA